MQERWPELPLDAWRDTYATLHRWTQIVGKTRLALTPHINHWWNVTLYVTSRGLSTATMYSGNIEVEVEFDFTTHELVIRTSAPAEARLPLSSKSVAVFYTEYMNALRLLGVDVRIHPVPSEVEDITPFESDEVHGTYDPEYANRHWRILLSADRVFSEFRSRFTGKSSPTHFFWGGFDLAQSRFSGRTAPPHQGGPPNTPIWVNHEGYSHELTSSGFWPGGAAGIDEPVFYAYAYPEPSGYGQADVEPAEAYYHETMKEFILPYEAVRKAKSPDRALLSFLQCTYEAGAILGKWDRAALERTPTVSTEDDQLTELEITENAEASRFEALIEGQTAFVEYRRKDDRIFLVHTIVPPSLEGQGIGTALAKYSLEFARRNSLRVVPSCPFIAAYIDEHPEYRELVAKP